MSSKDLACAVLHQAIEDLNNPSGSRRKIQDRESARFFLTEHNPRLDFWCALAEVNAEAIVYKAKKLLKD